MVQKQVLKSEKERPKIGLFFSVKFWTLSVTNIFVMPDFRHALILQHLQELQIGHPPGFLLCEHPNTSRQDNRITIRIKRHKEFKELNNNK